MKKYHYLAFGIFLIFFGRVFSQQTNEEMVYNQIEIGHDNDFFLLTDRYYSSGIFVGYTRKLKRNLFNTFTEQLRFNLGQEVYTPNNIDTELISEIDRLYAGYLRLNSVWSGVQGNTLLEIGAQVGIAGPASGAGAFQRWYHNAIVRWPAPTWENEINNQFHANLLAGIYKEWKLAPVPFGVHLAVSATAAAGSKDIYAQPQFTAFFGRRNEMKNSIAYNQIGSTQREIYFALSVGYRFVGYNAFLQEEYTIGNSTFDLEPKSAILNLGFDFRHRSDKNDYKIGYRFTTREAASVTDHQFLTLSYGRSF